MNLVLTSFAERNDSAHCAALVDASPQSLDSAAGLPLATHLPRMHAVARRVLRSDDLAWDAVQEALLTLWTEPEPPADARGWLVRTVLHRALHQARTLARRRRHEELAARERGAARVALDTSLEGADVLAQIERAVAALPADFRTAFELREIAGLEYADIAQRARVPIGTVRSRINRAKAQLRRSLAHLMHDERVCAVCARRKTAQPHVAARLADSRSHAFTVRR